MVTIDINEFAERVQDNLLLIIHWSGWSCEKFGDFLGYTRQSIYNFVKHITVLKPDTAMAIDWIIFEIMPDNAVAKILMEELLSPSDNYDFVIDLATKLEPIDPRYLNRQAEYFLKEYNTDNVEED